MRKPEAYRLLIADVYELAGASRAASELIAQRTGQTASRWHVLSVLTEPRTVASAARRLGLTRQSVHRVVDGLIADNLASTHHNPDHRSAALISLTPAGADALRKMSDAGDLERTRLLGRAGVTIEQMNAARAVLEALAGEFRRAP